MQVQVAIVSGQDGRAVLNGTSEEVLRLQEFVGSEADVVVVELDVYRELLQQSSAGSSGWDATADTLDAALRALCELPDGYRVTWWMPLGRTAPLYGFRVEPGSWDGMQGLLISVADGDPGRAFASMYAWVQDLQTRTPA